MHEQQIVPELQQVARPQVGLRDLFAVTAHHQPPDVLGAQGAIDARLNLPGSAQMSPT